MRLLHAVLADIRFQIKQGFYLVYVVITAMYLIIMSFLPDDILAVALPLVVFSDPSVLGLFFIGGIILMEKGQGVNQYMLKTIPYMLLFILPCFALLGFPYSELFVIIPSVAALKLMLGAFHGISWYEATALVFYLLGINYLFLKLAVRVFEKRIVYQD
jgi:hypothetical protein